MVGNYENGVFAQPVEDWRLLSYESTYDNLNSLMGMGLANVGWKYLPTLWGQSINGITWVWGSLILNV